MNPIGLNDPALELEDDATETDDAAEDATETEGATTVCVEVEVTVPRALDLKELQARNGGGSLVQKRMGVAEIDAAGDVLSFSFSSEQPVERWFGTEVLSHEPGAADLSRLNDGAPFLWNHDPDKVLGVLQSASIAGDRRGHCSIRWSRNAFATEKRQDVEDGILRNVSFMYSIDDAVERNGEILVTRWTPLETSLVSIPADQTVGLGRSFEPVNSLRQDVSQDPAVCAAPSENMNMETPTLTPDEIRSQAIEAERSRIASIQALGERLGMADLARELIDGGRSLDEARAAFLDKQATRGGAVPTPVVTQSPEIGLTEKEVKRFSFVKALNYLANPGDRAATEAAAFEIEVGRAAAAKYERSSNGIVVPNEVLARDLVAGTASAGGATISTDLLAGSFIELLRNRLALANAGVTVLSGLQGNVAIPRQTSASQAYWVGESQPPTESQQGIDQINMTPKTIGAYVDYSRRLLLQSSIDVEAMVRSDLARVIALELDRAGIYGSGSSNQPLGLVNTTGVASASLTNYGTFAELIAMETAIATANADAGSLRYIMNAAARGALKSTAKSSSAVAAGFVWEGGEVNGYPAIVSNQLQSNDALFGDFSMFIMGMWSGLDLMVDPYAGSTAGTVRIIALQDVDYAIKQPVAFCYAT
jgi:HK97 family phage major capsid protein